MMTLDEYLELLTQRREEWLQAHNLIEGTRAPALLEWFIEEGDEPLVDLPAPARRQQHISPSGSNRPDHCPGDLDALVARRTDLAEQRARLGAGGSGEDPAAVNLSPTSRSRSAARAGRRRFAQMDRELERYRRLTRQIRWLDSQIARLQRSTSSS